MLDDKAEQPCARFAVGALAVTSLNDGVLEVPADRFPSMHRATEHGVQRPIRVGINAFLVEHRGAKYLIDAGSGDHIGPSVGRVQEGLRACGASPNDIDCVLMTHFHIDHAGGLLAGREPVYPRAVIMASRAEFDYWRQPTFPEGAPAAQMASASVAARVFEGYRDRLRPFEAEAEIVSGICAVPLPGHTPGHTGFLLTDEGDQLLIWGDIVHSTIQLENPSLFYNGDVGRDVATATRIRLLAEAANEELPVGGMHLPFPAVGRVEVSGNGYSFKPFLCQGAPGEVAAKVRTAGDLMRQRSNIRKRAN